MEKGGEVNIEEDCDFEDEEEGAKEEADFDDSPENGAIFTCPNDKCTLEFLRYDRLERHLMSDQCKIKVPVIRVEDQVRSMYLSAFGVGFSEKIGDNEEIKDMVAHLTGYPSGKVCNILKLDTPLAPLSTPRNKLFGVGFALPQPKERTHFKENVVAFVQKIFEEGLNKRKKATAQEVAMRMRTEKIGRNLRFSSKDWLTEQQVKGLFCRFSAKLKKGEALSPQGIDSIEDTEEEEMNLLSARAVENITQNIIEDVEDDIPDINDHPVLVGEISLCDLSRCLQESKDVLKVFQKVKKREIHEIIDAIGATELKEKRFADKYKEENLKILSERIQKHVKYVCGCIL